VPAADLDPRFSLSGLSLVPPSATDDSGDRWYTTVAMRKRKGGRFGISHPEGSGSAQQSFDFESSHGDVIGRAEGQIIAVRLEVSI